MMYANRSNGILALLLCSTPAFAIDFNAQAQQEITIPHADGTVIIDGEFNDDIWQNAQVINLGFNTSPYDNTPSQVRTEAKMVTNNEYLLIAFTAYDPEPAKIVASFGERDTRWFDDSVGIKIDPFNNRRISYSFFANAYGVQNDETYNEVSGEANELWDGIWHSYGKVTEFGYQVEIAIPFHILNFEDNKEQKAWPFELVRIYPRDSINRLSNIGINRDNPCYLCQYPKASGFKDVKAGNAVQLTPALVGIYNEQRDIYNESADWQDDVELEPSLDIRWSIDKQNLLNVTLNPDFSTVEADAAQLNVNETFSLFYDEKRSFFLENNAYFEGLTNLVYTRNISDPDYGVKFSGTRGDHTYAAFVSHDNETNFILSGNISAQIASLNTESHSGAFRYLYDASKTTTVGLTSTFRKADDYHNYVYGIDGRHKLTESDSVKFQLLASDTLYPQDLFQHFLSYGTEQALRAQKDQSFSDISYQLGYNHYSEYWKVDVSREAYGDDFRADLGFVNRVDYIKDNVTIMRTFYQDDQTSMWPKIAIGGEYELQHNFNNELITKQHMAFISAVGPMLSHIELTLIDADKVGLRYVDEDYNPSALSIDGNTSRFNEQQFQFYGEFRPNNITYVSLEGTLGDKIDYDNDRLGDLVQLTANFTWNPTPHIELDFYQTYSELDAESENVFTANLTDLRLRYYFDAHSAIKFSLVYQDIDYNPNNNQNSFYTEKEKTLSTQLIYSYKLNPQTVFFFGYSDASYQDDYIGSLRQEQRTIFSKVSYAWR